jgi:hypothetical protein
MSRNAMQVGEECRTKKAGGEMSSEERLGVCLGELGDEEERVAG